MAIQDLSVQFSPGDKIVSFSPPSLSYPLIQLLLSKSKAPSTIIQLSSTSIDTKVLSGSADSSSYLHFLTGEHSIVSACLSSEQPVHLYILRLSLLWGSADKNVSRIYQILTKYRIFPLLSSSKSLGSRAPILQAARMVYPKNLLTTPVQQGIYNVMGPEVFSYDKMVKDIGRTVDSPIYLLKLNRYFLALLLRLALFLRAKAPCSILSMILRQKMTSYIPLIHFLQLYCSFQAILLGLNYFKMSS